MELSDDEANWEELGQSVPKRGDKDFDQDGSEFQLDALERARRAMYGALAVGRRVGKDTSVGLWDLAAQVTRVARPRGLHYNTIGRVVAGVLTLTVYETVYLAERGSLVVEVDGVEISMEQLYQEAAGDWYDAYQVYASLRRHGYIVMDWCEPAKTEAPADAWTAASAWTAAGKWLQNTTVRFTQWVSPQTTYASILRPLQVVRTEHPPGNTTSPYTPTFSVWKPGGTFKKKLPRTPDWVLLVVRADCPFPTLAQVEGLFSTLPETASEPPTPSRALLRTGTAPVLLAVVSSGLVSYVRLARLDFPSFHLRHLQVVPRPACRSS